MPTEVLCECCGVSSIRRTPQQTSSVGVCIKSNTCLLRHVIFCLKIIYLLLHYKIINYTLFGINRYSVFTYTKCDVILLNNTFKIIVMN